MIRRTVSCQILRQGMPLALSKFESSLRDNLMRHRLFRIPG